MASKTASTNKAPSFWLHFAAGGIGGTVGAAVTCPLEVVKTRLQSSLYRADNIAQTSRNPIVGIWNNITGVASMLRTIQQKEGIRALWKGLGPNLVGVVPARSIYFAVYGRCKHFYSQLNNGNETSLVHVSSAATAGVATATFTNPIWVIKTRMQLQSEDPKLRAQQRYRNSMHCGYLIMKEEGVRGLYRGLSASFLGLAESTLQFAMYEYFKRLALERRREIARSRGVGEEGTLEWLDTFGCAATAKLIAALATYPHE
eukprot:jgi/Hompol1/2571/HPOL_006063-RA